MFASGRLSASTVPAYCRSINRPGFASPTPSSSARCARQPVTHTPIPPCKATGRWLDPTSSNLTPRPNLHRARGTDRAPTFRDFVPWRFSDAGRPSMWRLRHCRRPKTCTEAELTGLCNLHRLRCVIAAMAARSSPGGVLQDRRGCKAGTGAQRRLIPCRLFRGVQIPCRQRPHAEPDGVERR
jgi:hypothetical protein